MVSTLHKTILLIVLLLATINLAGHFVAPTSCCTVQTDSGTSASDLPEGSDCVACLLQVGLWAPKALNTEIPTGLNAIPFQHSPLSLVAVFSIYHPPIV